MAETIFPELREELRTISHRKPDLIMVNTGQKGCKIIEVTVCFDIYMEPWGGGYFVYLSNGDVPFFRVSFSPIFSRTGYQKKANFLKQVVKTCQKRKFCYNGLLFSQIFVFLSIIFTEFF